MRRNVVLLVAIAAIVTFGLIGCGGGDEGNGGGGNIAAELIGTWQVFLVEVDGTVVAPDDERAMDWDQGVVRMTVQFNADGTVTVRYYDVGGNEVETENGTWEAPNGQVTITMGQGDDADVVELAYQVQGNLLDTTQNEDGQQSHMRWVKVLDLAENDADMVGAWGVASTTVNGADVPPTQYFSEAAGADAIVFDMQADGTFTYREMVQGEVAGEEQGTWATGGGAIAITLGNDTMRGQYVANNTSATFLDPEGDTAHIEFVPLDISNQTDPALVGTWQPYAATQNDAVCPVGTALNWGPDTVNQRLAFANDGTLQVTTYFDDGSDQAADGTWGVDADELYVLIGGGIEQLTYAVNDNLAETEFTQGGNDYVVFWAKVVDLTQHDAQMVRTWNLDSIATDGADTPITEFFGSPPEVDSVNMQLLADGTMFIRQLDGEEIVVTETGTWATGGGEMTVTLDAAGTVRGAYVVNNSSFTFLNDDGSSVKFELSPFAPAGDRDATLVDAWAVSSVTENGEAADLDEFFIWEQGTDSHNFAFYADGTIITSEYAGNTVNYADMGTWNSNGGVLTLTIGGTMTMDSWQIAGDTLTLEFTDGTNDIVITLDRVV